MRQNTLSKETEGVNVYESPYCDVLFVDPQKVICDRDTENVGKDE